MKKLLTLDAWIGIVLMIFSVWFWILCWEFPAAAQLFPRFFLGTNCLLSALLVINTVRHNLKGDGDTQNALNWKEFSVIIEAYLIIMVYVVCIDFIGFFVSTSVFLIGFMLFLNVRKPLTLICVTAGMDLFLYLLFSVGLRLNLPAGLLF